MKKKMLAVLVVLALIISLVPTAFAATEHDHTWSKSYVSLGNCQHAIVCDGCGEEQAGSIATCTGFGANCWLCGGSLTPEESEKPEEPACEHEWKGVVNNNDGTHNVVCRDCLEVLDTVDHDYNAQGTCECGAIYVEPEEPACKHEWKGVVNNNDGTHNVVCRDCLEVLDTVDHDYNAQGTCACGAIYVEPEEPACKHEWKGVVNKDEASHKIVCRDCLEVLGVESHMYVDNRPCACGAIYVHDHSFAAGITANDDGTHKVNCDCGAFVTVNCLDNDGDGKCDSCGYVKYAHECDFMAGVTSNEDGTHNVNCSCGKYVTVNCLDNDGDGKCDSCGYVKYAHECDFMAGVTSNEDGTHNVNCSCGKYVTVKCLDNNGDGKCDSCGYLKYEEPEDPTEPEEPTVEPEEPTVEPEDPTEPEKPTVEPEEPTVEPEEPTVEPEDPTTDEPEASEPEATEPAELDDVPKTGDNTVAILGVMTGIALVCAMAFVFVKKRSAY